MGNANSQMLENLVQGSNCEFCPHMAALRSFTVLTANWNSRPR